MRSPVSLLRAAESLQSIPPGRRIRLSLPCGCVKRPRLDADFLYDASCGYYGGLVLCRRHEVYFNGYVASSAKRRATFPTGSQPPRGLLPLSPTSTRFLRRDPGEAHAAGRDAATNAKDLLSHLRTWHFIDYEKLPAGRYPGGKGSDVRDEIRAERSRRQGAWHELQVPGAACLNRSFEAAVRAVEGWRRALAAAGRAGSRAATPPSPGGAGETTRRPSS